MFPHFFNTHTLPCTHTAYKLSMLMTAKKLLRIKKIFLQHSLSSFHTKIRFVISEPNMMK